MGNYKITKVDLIILKDLIKKKKNNFLNSLSIYELEILKVSKQNTIYKRIKYLEEIGFVEKGLKNGKKITYYITDLGFVEMEKLNKKN